VVCGYCNEEMQRRFLDKHLTECRERIVQCTLCEEEFAFWRLKVIACRDDVLENYNMNFVEAFSLMPTPRFSFFNVSHTDFVIFKYNLHSASIQKLLTAKIRSNLSVTILLHRRGTYQTRGVRLLDYLRYFVGECVFQ